MLKKDHFLYKLVHFCAFALLVFTLTRTVLLAVSWSELNHEPLTILYIYFVGLLYDLGFLVYLALFFWVFNALLPVNYIHHRVRQLFSVLLLFGLAYGLLFTAVAEWFFWDEFSTRFNFISVDYLIYRQEVTDNIFESYPVVPLLVLIGVVAALYSGFVHYWPPRRGRERLELKFGTRVLILLALLGASALVYALIGQAQHDLSGNNYANELASNGPYQFVAAYRNNSLDFETFYLTRPDPEVSDALKAMIPGTESGKGLYDISRMVTGVDRGRPNVILVSVESLSADYMTRFGNVNNITPFLDSLVDESLFFSNFYATGTRTVRGLESITLSIPPTPGRSVVKRPDNDHFQNLGKVYADDGYDVAFLYGGRGYFDNMNAFFSGNGYRIVDQTSVRDREIEFANAWGMSDGDLYRIAVDEANGAYAQDKPFFLHVMTTSNHRPYTYPEGYIDLPSGSGRAGAVKYTDYALKAFIESARQQPWFDNTVFVIVADHCASSAGRVNLPVQKYHIPMWIYAPKLIEPAIFDQVASQIDIAPTLLGITGQSYRSWFFGQDMLSDSFESRALLSNYQYLGLKRGDAMTILKPRKLVDRMVSSSEGDRVSAANPDDPEVLQSLAYYQGADFILRHRLNRFQQ